VDETREQELVTGHVKWFDPGKGFGFVVSDSGGGDILLHANVLRNFGQSSIADGARVEILVQRTARGQQAVEVVSITAQPVAPPTEESQRSELFDPNLQGGPRVPARIKWFDKGKGFGFANVFGHPEDVFVHIEVVRRAGLADLQAGEAVTLRVADGKRGKLATEVGTWDSVLHGSH
jgi:CspA family cold shock protein